MRTVNHQFKDFVPDYIISILHKIEHHGFEVFIVGGAVRDLLMGRVPIEYDLATNATPSQICDLFNEISTQGIQFGTVMVHYEGRAIEITTYREESVYDDHRHPDVVTFVNDILVDLKRRDFTINAMAYQPLSGQLIDPYDGQLHLQERRLVCVGSPNHRFTEDSLRVFRCFRFMAQFGFTLDGTIVECLPLLPPLPLPTMPRIRQEMDRLLMGKYWGSALAWMSKINWLLPWFESDTQWSAPTLKLDVLYRWAWLLSQGDFEVLSQKFQFSKKDIRFMSLILEWEFDSLAIELSVTDLKVSATDLQAMGFSGPALGQIQQTLLYQVRSKQLNNQPNELIQFIQQLQME
ncbi:MAG: hypothetical protein VW397_07055 [Candidatus Margulisiibacteriota bacterium]